MIIGLDYDGTFTEDPEFWVAVVRLAKSRGHDVAIVTARNEEAMPPVRKVAAELGIEAVGTGGKPKIQYADSIGLLITIWIDDLPGLLFSDVTY